MSARAVFSARRRLEHRDETLSTDLLNGPLDGAAGLPRRAVVVDRGHHAGPDGPAPGPDQALQATRRLGSELDLDRDRALAGEDRQVGPVQTGPAHPFSQVGAGDRLTFDLLGENQ